MHLPFSLQQTIESLVESVSLKDLKSGREDVSADYREGFDSHKAFQNKAQILSYLVTRFPATFAANRKVFQELKNRIPSFRCKSILDLGSGPGSASWAASDIFEELKQIYLVERESAAIDLGKKLAKSEPMFETKSLWTLSSLEQTFTIPEVDVAVFSYVLGEITLEKSIAILEKVSNSAVSVIAIVEPGTPKGYERIIQLRTKALEWGLNIVAPCPHHFNCPMLGKSWCHFAARVERTKLHRQLKGGTLGYEDEKFSYLNIDDPSISLTPIQGRLVHQPFKGSGHVKLPLCASTGDLKELVITKKNKEEYRLARDAEWGAQWM